MPSLLATAASSSSVITQTTPTMTTAKDSLRLAAETLFKSNSVHRYPSNNFICSDCHRTFKRCDVSVQTSLDDNTNYGAASRLRLVSLTASDDGLGGDGTWLSLDPHQAQRTAQEYQMRNTILTPQDTRYDELSSRSMPRMHHV
jgi:alpha-D-ribose 1-methylphosphonate 5-triphosphate diphosphatase PhnM